MGRIMLIGSKQVRRNCKVFVSGGEEPQPKVVVGPRKYREREGPFVAPAKGKEDAEEDTADD